MVFIGDSLACLEAAEEIQAKAFYPLTERLRL